MANTVLEPVDMEWVEKGVLAIDWSDGHKGIYPVRYLRQHCPCAQCTDEMTGELKLQPDDVAMLIMVKDVEPVGRYALRFIWSDGHDTGIYSFTFLRRTCQCDVCVPVKPKEAKSRRLLGVALLIGLLAALATALEGCSTLAAVPLPLPPLDVQKQHILNEQFPLRNLSAEAFIATWGVPAYSYEGPTQFFVLTDGQRVPGFRVPLGEAPKNWDNIMETDIGRFYAYPDHGQLVGFIDGRLVYRETLTAPQLHAIGKGWAQELKFRTSIENDMLKRR